MRYRSFLVVADAVKASDDKTFTVSPVVCAASEIAQKHRQTLIANKMLNFLITNSYEFTNDSDTHLFAINYRSVFDRKTRALAIAYSNKYVLL